MKDDSLAKSVEDINCKKILEECWKRSNAKRPPVMLIKLVPVLESARCVIGILESKIGKVPKTESNRICLQL